MCNSYEVHTLLMDVFNHFWTPNKIQIPDLNCIHIIIKVQRSNSLGLETLSVLIFKSAQYIFVTINIDIDFVYLVHLLLHIE